MRKLSVVALLGSMLVLASACGGGASAPTPATSTITVYVTSSDASDMADEGAAPPSPSLSPLNATVTGTCKNPTGMKLNSSGFTPNSTYSQKAWYPNGALYQYLATPGTTDSAGGTPNWSWNCYDTHGGSRDPAGRYRLLLKDDSTGRSLTVYFQVSY